MQVDVVVLSLPLPLPRAEKKQKKEMCLVRDDKRLVSHTHTHTHTHTVVQPASLFRETKQNWTALV